MPIFQSKPRTVETYLAGIGASGALMGSAFVMFVILVGVVTFNAWPHTGSLFGDGGDVGLRPTAASAPAPQHTKLNLVKLLGGSPVAATHHRGRVHGRAPIANGGIPDTNGGSNGGPSGGQAPVQAPQPSPPPPTQPRNLISQTLSGVGDTVQSDTQTLGGTVNSATGTNLGGVVTNVGGTLNNTLQSLAGK